MSQIEKIYRGYKVRVFKIDTQSHPYPWRFEITVDGVVKSFAGIPNQCETSRQALKRAWWRCYWLESGTFNQKYT